MATRRNMTNQEHDAVLKYLQNQLAGKQWGRKAGVSLFQTAHIRPPTVQVKDKQRPSQSTQPDNTGTPTKKKPNVQQLTEQLDNVLDALVAGEFTELDGADPDLEQSGQNMEEAVRRLDAELFTEEEKILVNRVKELERNYQTDHDKEAFAKGIEALINELTEADEQI